MKAGVFSEEEAGEGARIHSVPLILNFRNSKGASAPRGAPLEPLAPNGSAGFYSHRGDLQSLCWSSFRAAYANCRIQKICAPGNLTKTQYRNCSKSRAECGRSPRRWNVFPRGHVEDARTAGLQTRSFLCYVGRIGGNVGLTSLSLHGRPRLLCYCLVRGSPPRRICR